MLTQESRARLRALATDALRGGYDYEAHEKPYVNLAGCVCATPATILALLSALDAAERERDSAWLTLDHIDREVRGAEDVGAMVDDVTGTIDNWREAKAKRAYDAATTAKEGTGT